MSEQTTADVTVTDPRVLDIATRLGADPAEVLASASAAASEDGVSVGDELDAGESLVTLLDDMSMGDDEL